MWKTVLAGVFSLALACGREGFLGREPTEGWEIPLSSLSLDAGALGEGEWALYREAALVDTLQLPQGPTGFALLMRGTPCEGTWPVVEVSWNMRTLARFPVASEEWRWYRVPLRAGGGTGVLRIALVNDRFSPKGDVNLYLRRAVVVGEEK